MPIVTNHKGPSFREYSRTPTEKKIIELEKRLLSLEERLAQYEPTSDSANKDDNESTSN